MSFAQHHVKLPSPAIQAREALELETTETASSSRSLPVFLEPLSETMR